MKKTPLMRSFIAINPDAVLQKALNEIAHALQRQPHSHTIKWSRPENFHLTLNFLGEIPPAKVEEISALLAITLKNTAAFTIALGKITVFPPAERPYMLVLTVSISPTLADLVQTIEKTIIQCGLAPEERAYLPHITLGRLRKDYELDLTNISGATLPKEFLAQEVIFYRSELTEQGSLYTALKKFKLK